MAVSHDLHLDVPGGLEIPLQEHLVRAEGRSGLALGGGHGLGELARRPHETHAPTTTSG